MIVLANRYSSCAIIGGVLTVAGLVDSMIFSGSKRLGGRMEDGFAAPGGKMVSCLNGPILCGMTGLTATAITIGQ